MSTDESGKGRVAPLPSNGVLLHIGLFKTGTTAVQSTLRSSRDVLAEHDVLYRGPSSWKYQSLRSVMADQGKRWSALRQAVRGHRGRAMVSAENMCTFDDAAARQLVAELAGDRPVRVLITARPIADLLPSTWQQDLRQNPRTTGPYAVWLDEVSRGAGKAGQRFWDRNDIPGLLRRWGSLVGEENVVIVMTDKKEPERALRVVEGLMDLPEHTLHLSSSSRSNPSRTFEEAEFLRAINERTLSQLSEAQYRSWVKEGVVPAIVRGDVTPGTRIPLPADIAEAVTRAGREQAAQLTASPATVVGDVTRLADRSAPLVESPQAPTLVPIDVAVAAVTGGLFAAAADSSRAPEQRPREMVGSVRRWLASVKHARRSRG